MYLDKPSPVMYMRTFAATFPLVKEKIIVGLKAKVIPFWYPSICFLVNA